MDRVEWNAKSSAARSAYIEAVAASVKRDSLLQKFDMQFSHMKKFGSFETGVFTVIPGSEFVYIPADSAILGFDRNFVLPPRMMDAFKSAFELYSPKIFSESCSPDDTVMAELEKMMSPLRTGSIREMLVETEYAEYEYSDDGLLLEYFIRDNHKVAKCRSSEQTEIIGFMNSLGFDCCNEDEWEYLSGGYYRNLYNESMTKLYTEAIRTPRLDELKAQHKDAPHYKEIYWTLFYNEMFTPEKLRVQHENGLYIAYHPYEQELVSSPCLTKGSDGGGALHGGDGVFGYLPCSPHHRFADAWIEYIYIRRVVDVGNLLCGHS